MNIPTNPIASFFGANLGSVESDMSLMGQGAQTVDFQAMLAQFALPENSEIAQILSPEEMMALGAILQQDVSSDEQVESLQSLLQDLQQLEQALAAGEEIDPVEVENVLEGLQSLLASFVMTQTPEVKVQPAPYQEIQVPDEDTAPVMTESDGPFHPSQESTTLPEIEPLSNPKMTLEQGMGKVEQTEFARPSADQPVREQEMPEEIVNSKDASLVVDEKQPAKGFAWETEGTETHLISQDLPAPIKEQIQKIQQVMERVGKLNQLKKEAPITLENAESIVSDTSETEEHPILARLQSWVQSTSNSLETPKESVESKNPFTNALPLESNGNQPRYDDKEASPQTTLQTPIKVIASESIPNMQPQGSEVAEKPQAPMDGTSQVEQTKTLESAPTTSTSNLQAPQQASTPQRSQMAERYDEFQAVRQVSQKVQWMVRNGEGKAILRLDPPELGHIEIEVETKSGEMKIHMSVENESVKNTLETSAPQLRQSMEQHQVKIEKLEVQVETRLDAQGGQADPQKSRRSENAQRQHRRGMKIAEVLVDVPRVDTGRRLGYNTMELIA